MKSSHLKFQGKRSWLLLLAALIFSAGGTAIWMLTAGASYVAPAPARMVTASGDALSSFFRGLPVSPRVRIAKAANARRYSGPKTGLRAVAERAAHFLGFGAVVYAADVCAGCSEYQADPTDCGCGQRSWTFGAPEWTGQGFTLVDNCVDCSPFQGAEVCSSDCAAQ